MNFYNPPHLWHAFRGRLLNEFLQNQPHLWHALRGRLCKMNFYRTRPICGMQTIRTNSWISYARFVAAVSNDFLRKLCPIFGRSYPLVSQEFMPYCGKSSHLLAEVSIDFIPQLRPISGNMNWLISYRIHAPFVALPFAAEVSSVIFSTKYTPQLWQEYQWVSTEVIAYFRQKYSNDFLRN